VRGLEGAVEVQWVAKSAQGVDEIQLEEAEEEAEEEEEEVEEEVEGCHDSARTGPMLAEFRAKKPSFQEGFVGALPPELDVQLAEHGANILQCLRYSVSLHIYIIFMLSNSLKLALP
jgi:hypothetical protein